MLRLALLLWPAWLFAAQTDPADANVVARTNDFRKAHGPQTVSPQSQLEAAAHGYDACIVSENIARVYRSKGYDATTLARDMVEGWKESPAHRDAMLDPAVTQIGVGIARSTQGRYYGVQLFGRPKSGAIRFTVRNMSRQAISYRTGSLVVDRSP